MGGDTTFIATIVVGLGLAFAFGALANRLKVPLIVGYLLAGVAVGPYTPGFVANQQLASQLAEIGVILLMFGVGLHFSPGELLAVRKIVVPGAMLQILASTTFGMAIGLLLGWPIGSALVFGLALSVASTVVLMRALQDRRLLDTDRGRVAAGWLIVQDVLMVLVLILLPPLASLLDGELVRPTPRVDLGAVALAIAVTFGKVAGFVALMLVVGRRIVPLILHYVAHTGSRELFRLAVLALALGVAFGAAELFNVSFALGAFLAGMILSESELSQRAAEESLPLRDAFAALFFISVGMLFDPLVVLREPLPLLATLLVVMVGNAGVAFLIVRLLGYPIGTALTIAAGLAQIGEFSFILADLGIGLRILPERARDLLLGASILSILVNPILFAAKERLRLRAQRDGGSGIPVPPPEAELEIVPTALRDHVVLVGCGRVGQIVCDGLLAEGWPVFVIEEGDAAVERLRARSIEAIAGNAARPELLKAANLTQARMLFVAIPNAFEAGQIIEQARKSNSALQIVARAHYDAEIAHLAQLGADSVIMGEQEIARTMLARARAQQRDVAAAVPEEEG
jgi:monovalent cation:H+ antiporter-2, CPA2 family